MGITFLAAGTSVPDCMASLIVARQGKCVLRDVSLFHFYVSLWGKYLSISLSLFLSLLRHGGHGSVQLCRQQYLWHPAGFGFPLGFAYTCGGPRINSNAYIHLYVTPLQTSFFPGLLIFLCELSERRFAASHFCLMVITLMFFFPTDIHK